MSNFAPIAKRLLRLNRNIRLVAIFAEDVVISECKTTSPVALSAEEMAMVRQLQWSGRFQHILIRRNNVFTHFAATSAGYWVISMEPNALPLNLKAILREVRVALADRPGTSISIPKIWRNF